VGGQNSWRIAEDMDDYLRQQEKRLAYTERIPVIRSAGALLGPGIAPFAVFVNDWNEDVTSFNGIFYSEPGAINSPDGTKYWMGQVMATDEGFGMMNVWEFRDGGLPPANYIRTFGTTGSALRTFSAWTVV
jgi:hypothetical protein